MAATLSCAAQAAKSMRVDLKAAFRGHLFSVRTKNYSGGSSISVYWRDGPTAAAVRAVIGKYADGYFDGMDDSYKLLPENVGGTRFVFECRKYSKGIPVYIAQQYCKKVGVVFEGMEQRIDSDYLREIVFRLLADFDLSAVDPVARAGRFARVALERGRLVLAEVLPSPVVAVVATKSVQREK